MGGDDRYLLGDGPSSSFWYWDGLDVRAGLGCIKGKLVRYECTVVNGGGFHYAGFASASENVPTVAASYYGFGIGGY